MIIKTEKAVPLYEKFGLFTEAPKKRRPRVIRIAASRGKNYIDDIEDPEVEDMRSAETDTSDEVSNINDDDAENIDPGESQSSEFPPSDEIEDADPDSESREDNVDDDSTIDSIDVGNDELEDYTDDAGPDEPENVSSDQNASDVDSDGEVESGDEAFNKNDMRKFMLYKRYIEFHNAVEYFISKLESSISDDRVHASTMAHTLSTFRKLESTITDYMTLKFTSDSYLQNSFFFEKIKATVLLSLEILNTSKNKDNRSKH